MRRSSKSLSLSLALIVAAGAPGLLAQPAASLEAPAERVISLASRVIDTAAPEPELPAALRAPAAAPGEDEVVLVKFPGPPTARQIAALEAASVRVYAYLPYYAFLVKLPAGAATGSFRAGLGASWSGPYHPAYKISPEIAAVEPAEAAGDAARAPAAYRPVMVHVFPDADLAEVLRSLRDLGVQGIAGAGRAGSFSRVRLLLAPAEIAALREPLAALPEVFWLELEGRRTLVNDTTVWVGQSGLAGGQTTPIFGQGIFGEGQTVGIIDTGIDPDMCFFRDTSLGLPPTNPCNGGTVINAAQRKVVAVDFLTASECAGGIGGGEWDTHDHGTHVAGTVAGDNFANPLVHDTADGMAPGAKLVIQDAGFATDNCGDLPGIGCPVVDLNPIFQQAYDQGARLHTNSWGDNENAPVQNNYSAGSQDVDEFMWNHKDFQIFFAAGNSGPGSGSVGSPSTAKSAVSVGATLRGTSAESMASFSSCGPTADGRIKPEVTVPGSSIVSANNDGNVGTNNCGTLSLSGTSMASPGAAGLAALIRQYYADGWYPTGGEVSTDGFTPSAALVRATLVNSAVGMANTTAIPANCQGWGRVLLENALFFTGQSRGLRAEDAAAPFATGSSGEDRTFNYTVANGGEPLKVTLAWTDFPSTPAANPNLVNDLDLRVTGPTGTLWLGNVFSGGASATGGSADRRNTLEQVLLPAPATGAYTVTVRSFNVPSGPQPFALVVTGGFTAGGGNPTTVTFTSVASQDGYVLESSENSNAGGSGSSTSSSTSALRAGDATQDRQYKAFVSFNTAAIPDGATVVSATLRLRRGTVAGTNPFGTHGTCWADVQTGGFSGSTTLQTGDFQAAATVVQAASMSNAATNGAFSEGSLNAAGLAAINKTGTTQLRVYFNLGDNDDGGNDYIGWYSGDNGTAANRPQLVVTYQ